MELLDLLQQPFMLRALYGGLIVAILCAVVGVFVTLKNESFMADAVAHASLSGVALAFLLAWQPIPLALLVGVIMAIGITYLKKNSTISADSLIGIFYSVLFALGIVLINLNQSYQPELSTYLFGSILSISWVDILYSVITLTATTTVIGLMYHKFVYMTFDPEAAQIRGINTHALEYLLSILSSITIIVSIKIVGIILVAALLIIPATTAKLLAKSFTQMIPIALLYSIFTTLAGIFVSYYLDTPTGATIVLFSGLLFSLIFILKKLTK